MTARPVRLRLSRRKGFDLQALSRATNGLPAVNCARPGKWGNPHTRDNSGSVPVVLRYVCETLPLLDVAPLRGKNLACWCSLCRDHAAAGKPLCVDCNFCESCHVDHLGQDANPPGARGRP